MDFFAMRTLWPILLAVVFSSVAAAEDLSVVGSYEEFAAAGLNADVTYYKGKVMALGVKAADPKVVLPDWMQAFYVLPRNRNRGHASYIFDMRKPNRIGAFIGWSEEGTENMVLLVGPTLREGETFDDKKYIAISTADLIRWRGHKSAEEKK